MSATSVKRARNVLGVVKKPEKCTLHRISHGSIILNFNFLVTPEYSQSNEQEWKGWPYPLHKNGMIAWCFCARARRAIAWSVRCISRDSDTACRRKALPTASWAQWLQSWCNSCALFCFYFFIILMAMILSRNRSILQVQVRWSNKKVDCF